MPPTHAGFSQKQTMLELYWRAGFQSFIFDLSKKKKKKFYWLLFSGFGKTQDSFLSGRFKCVICNLQKENANWVSDFPRTCISAGH